ncbi:MAG: polysaccharide biosynthesis tyrosine autokinase [Nitrospirae bacterium]|nr:polysaccharide biosynthesis tyrosine autokinase [Nitrospirota bacterium]
MDYPPSSAQPLEIAPAPLRKYVRIIRKRKWILLGLVAFVIVGTTRAVMLQPLVYESTVSILVEPTGPNVVSKTVEEVYIPATMNSDYYKTQYEIVKSYQILREVVLNLSLQTHPEYLVKLPEPLDSWMPDPKTLFFSVLFPATSTQPDHASGVVDGEAERRLVRAFGAHVAVKPVMNSRIIRVAVESTHPQLAADAANMIASVYISRSLAIKVGAAEEATKWITLRVEEIRRKVEESERALQEFSSQVGLVNVGDRQRLVTQKLSELQTQLVHAETRRAEAEARFKQIASVIDNPRELESSFEVLSSGLIQLLRNQEIQAGQKVAELGDKYGPKHPAMVQATSEMNEIQRRIQLEIKKVYTSVKSEYDVAAARERTLRQALSQQKTEVLQTGQHEVQYGILLREAESNRQLYSMFLKRMKETDITTEIRTSNIYVMDPAIVSLVAVKPKRTQTVLLATLFGLLGAVGLIVFLDIADNSLKSPEDVAQSLRGLAFLGFLPAVRRSRRHPSGAALIAHEDQHSIFAEQIRSIRTGLLLSESEKPPTSFVVTSAAKGEGKTTFAINLAIAFSQMGHRTVLIDGDLRNPRLHQVFGFTVEKGLSQYLVGEAELMEIVQPTVVPNLLLIPCGAVPHNPVELLMSTYMQDLLESFRTEGLYVIIDCASMLAVSDPAIVSHHAVDGTILVVHAAHTTHEMAQASVRLLQAHQTKILGVVMQQLKQCDLSAYYSEYYASSQRKSYGRQVSTS